MNRSVLVIGGAGYIGPVLISQLLAGGDRVRCLDLLLYNNSACVTPFLGNRAYDFIFGDLADGATLDRALEGMTDVVILAGLVGDPITKNYPEAARSINDE